MADIRKIRITIEMDARIFDSFGNQEAVQQRLQTLLESGGDPLQLEDEAVYRPLLGWTWIPDGLWNELEQVVREGSLVDASEEVQNLVTGQVTEMIVIRDPRDGGNVLLLQEQENGEGFALGIAEKE